MQFGEKLRQLRQERGMTQKELAQRVNVSSQAISRWENSEVEPSLETLQALAGIFGVSMDALFGIETQAGASDTEKQNSQPNVNISMPQERVVLGVCEACNTPIYEKENIVRKECDGSKTLLCRACHYRAERKMAKNDLAVSLETRRDGYLYGSLVGGAILVIGIIATVMAKKPILLIPFGVIAVLAFMGLFCMMMQESFLGDMGASVASWSFHAPGIIFEWSAEGIMDLIALKIIFWLIGVVVGIATFLLAVTLVMAFAPFCFPYDVYVNNRDIAKHRDTVLSYSKKLEKLLSH